MDRDEQQRRPPEPEEQGDGQPENAKELEDPRGGAAESERRSAEGGEGEEGGTSPKRIGGAGDAASH